MIFAKREVMAARGAALARRVGRVCDLGALGCAANLGELDVTPEVERAREQSRGSEALQRVSATVGLPAIPVRAEPRALCVCDRGWVQGAGAARVRSRAEGHDLEALFRALPGELQAQIMADTTATYPGSEPYFDRDLAMVADVFEVWRYIHEQH